MGARLTEAQIAALRPQYTEYPERRIITPVYPAPRKKRGGTKAEQDAMAPNEPGAIPTDITQGAQTARIWSFHLQTANANRSVRATSPRFAGPGWIDFLQGVITLDNTGTSRPTWQLSFSDAPGQTGVSATIPLALPGTIIGDPIAATDGLTDPTIFSGILPEGSQQTTDTLHMLGIYVPLKSFHLNIGFQSVVAGTQLIIGYVRLIENYIATPKQ